MWLEEIQRFLPKPDLTIVLDIAPETAVQRKSVGRDRYERGVRALVTSGPTVEAIDPVRFIANRSSGQRGHAIAAACNTLA